jgi:hypothetical protein
MWSHYQKVFDVIGPGKPKRTIVANAVEIGPEGELVFFDRWSDSRDWAAANNNPRTVTRIPRSDWVFYFPRNEEIPVE